MIELKRRNTVWLTAMALLTVMGIIAAGSAPLVQLLLLSLFAMAAIASTVKLGANEETIIDALKRAPLRQRMSPQAKEAIERARTRGGYMSDDLIMLDIGLIAGQTNYEGMAFRRTRNVSKDDDGVRPFVTLNVDALEANRHATVRFEIYDQNGDELFVHEMRTYLREGEMSLMADHHLPLTGPERTFSVSGDALQSDDVTINVFANASYLQQEVKDLGGAPPIKAGGSYPRYRNFVKEGYSPGAFFGARVVLTTG